MALHEYQKQSYTKVATIAALIILPIAGFGVGLQYGKSSNKAVASDTPSSSSQGFSPNGQMPQGANNGQRPNIGTVTAVSATSITMESQMDGSETTFTITSDTEVTDDQESATVSDISTGDTVVIITDSSSSSQASQIMLNPSMGGGGGPGSI